MILTEARLLQLETTRHVPKDGFGGKEKALYEKGVDEKCWLVLEDQVASKLYSLVVIIIFITSIIHYQRHISSLGLKTLIASSERLHQFKFSQRAFKESVYDVDSTAPSVQHLLSCFDE